MDWLTHLLCPGGNFLGIVLNNINMSQDENYYYYSGYYGYYQYKYKPDAKDGKEGAEGKGPKTGEDASKKTGGSEIKPKY